MNKTGDKPHAKVDELKTQQTRLRFKAYFVLLLFVSICYANTLTSEWHLDDYPNIVQNKILHWDSLNLQSFTQIFSAHPREEGRLSRPVAYLSFALNWYFGADNVVGYHFINILIHLGTSSMLYLTAFLLLETPYLRKRSINTKHQAALLTALFWAMNPVQTQAVTYIVQRMAALATFFFLAAILCYLMGRRSLQVGKQFSWFLTGLACFILALGTKENSITLPAVLLLMEGIFFQSFSRIKKHYFLIGLSLFCLSGVAINLLTNGNPIDSIINFEYRSFTLWERVLTESRIMVFYLSQLFFPAPFRLSLVHDVTLSTSLLQPPTTLLSIAFLSALTIWALWKHKSSPFAAFAILFFLLNHVIESSIFPLELIFEHRNYLPSLFLFLPVAVLLVDTYENASLRPAPVQRHVLAGVVLLILCTLAAATYARNNVWHTEQSLWEDALAKAPGQSRPYINLAVTYQKQGRNDEAFELCRQSLTKASPTPAKDRMLAFNNMGNIAMDRGTYAEAIGYYRDALRANENPTSRYYLHKALLAEGQVDDARLELEALMLTNPSDSELMTSMAIIFANKQELSQAISMLHAAQDIAGKNNFGKRDIQICLGSVFSRQGDFKGADQQYREVLSYSEPFLPLLCIIGNLIQYGNQEAATAQLKEILKHVTKEELLKIIRSSSRQNVLFPVELKVLNDFIRSFTSLEPPSLIQTQ